MAIKGTVVQWNKDEIALIHLPLSPKQPKALTTLATNPAIILIVALALLRYASGYNLYNTTSTSFLFLNPNGNPWGFVK